jgi:23S rRNA (cytidine1920-2'-O)/16S rRNA (cytidine1409-2'-O)-methyltransferase
MQSPAELITLIKPQFEAGRDQVEKGGVVRNPAVHQTVLDTIQSFGTTTCGLVWKGVIPSPLKGPAGNIEFLAHWTLS